MQDKADIDALERRIAAAFDRIGKGLERIAPPAEDEGLRAELAVEREANAQLTERLRAVKEREGQARAALEARVAELTRQLDAQGLELHRLKKTVVQLRETLRAQADAMQEGTTEAHLINRAMLSELEALRALRQTEATEIEAILSELAPLIAGAEGDQKEANDA
jgi:chromosome segregation ATPase